MKQFEEFKKQVIDILEKEGLDKDTIDKILKDEDIYLAINNHFSAEVMAWTIMF